MPPKSQKKKTPDPQRALKAEIREKTLEIKVLRRISESISSSLDLEQVLNEIIGIVVEVTGADACLLYLLNEKKNELVLKATKNPHPRLIGRIRLELGEGITGWVARENRPVIIPKGASDDPRFKVFHNLPEDRYQAFFSVPVMSQGQVIGVINVQHKKPHPYSENETAFLKTIGQQVGGAIENARLYEEMRKKAVQVETLSRVSQMIGSDRYLKDILQLIVAMTAEMMGSTICSMMLFDKVKQELEIVATQSLSDQYREKPNLKVGQSISGRAVKEKKPIAVLDVRRDPGYTYSALAKKEGLCSLLSVPMMSRDRVIGVINSYTAGEHKFDDEEIKILQAVANQAAAVIENSTLLEKSNEMKEELETRKIVERAKGVLMRERKLVEEEAFRVIQRKSMNTRKSMREVAEAILLASDLENH